MKRIRVGLISFAAVLCFGATTKAEPLKDFLLCSAYGTAAGALLGVASLAFTDDPGSKMNNIARGASLGLYAGIGFGLYVVNGASSTTNGYTKVKFPSWATPVWAHGKFDGWVAHISVAQF